NVEKYIKRCLDSLIRQTLKDIEIIIIDDGSTDGSPAICDQYAKKDNRIRVIHKQNEGLGFARNTGLNYAKGDYIAFIDSDDYINETAFNKAYQEAISNNTDIAFYGFNIERKPGLWESVTEKEFISWIDKDIQSFMLDMIACAPHVKKERRYNMAVWHAIYRNSIIREHQIRFYSEREIVCEDIPFNIDILLRAKKIIYLPDPFYFYCLNGTSLTSTFLPEKFNRLIHLHTILEKKTKNINNATLRTDRFFIGFIRSYILNLTKSERKDKIKIIKTVVKNPIWNELKGRYSPSYLPLYQKIFYTLILKKQVLLLYLYSHLINFLKSKR
ncbi:MAG: glycosyltransferase, partial [Clostridia bacterium]|nr:glycosyltransferase [Clostridia bacterium]